MSNIENTIDRIQELLENAETEQQLREELNNFHEADLAGIFQLLKPEERLACFLKLNEEKAADVIEYLPAQLQVEILGDIDETLASRLISKLPHDDAADVLGDMEEDETEVYLEKLPEKFSSEIRELLTYNEDTAGGIMNPLVLTVAHSMSVKDALDTIRIKAEKDNMELYYVYVVDKQEHLLGVVSLRTLLTTPAHLSISEIMWRDIVKVHVDDYQGHIADIFMKYQFNALPVVDQYNRLKGIVTWDDVQDIVEEETTDEILTSSGIVTDLGDEDDDILTGSLANSIKARIPWLFITLIGEFIAVSVTNKYDHTFTALPVIAAFMPLLAGLGGNIGTQSITLMVRGMSTGQVTLSSGWHHIWKETFTGISIGFIFGILVMLVTWGWQHNVQLGLIVGIAMALNMTIATMIGTCTPLILKKMKIDPAVASGPVIATTIDVVGLAVYLTLVTWYLISV
ncbi:MAG: magnesium transporter [Cyanobacteria bacterium SIG28]|nr:magnesium transporter [Cyanobacteria bacterium SIG28]